MLCVRCKKRPAVVFVQKLEAGEQKSEGYCLRCAREMGIKPVDDLMKRFNITPEDMDRMEDSMNAFMKDMQSGDSDGMSDMMQMLGMSAPTGEDSSDSDEEEFVPGGSPAFPFGLEAREEKPDSKENHGPRKKKRKFLDGYCENLTAKAKAGRLDRIIGRDREIARTVQILSRRQKNNPCLIGEAGVGKTAIAEGIAQRIVEGKVPAGLRDKEIWLLDLTSLVAGTQFRGQFESRVKGLISEVKADGNIILFIDEVHSITGAGDSEGAMNAANILKPALSRGEIQVIGATTFAEYRKFIEKDKALERRFQPVKVEEPSLSDAIQLMQGVKSYYEDYHHVRVSDDIAAMTVRLSERYITDRFLPDKAIDLLDEACACCALRHPEISQWLEAKKEKEHLEQRQAALEQTEDGKEPDYEQLAKVKAELMQLETRLPELERQTAQIAVQPEDLAKVVELWTGVPAVKIQQSDNARLAGLENALKAHIIGQDEAVDQVVRAVRRSRANLSGRRKPASFIFVGPTGVGKTELVKQLAAALFDSVDPLIRFDMSEFMEKHTVSRLVGSPPGYVGYDEAGQLTEKVRRRPYSVVLFDEIEKAHPDVMNILLQILDEGRITDAQGRSVDFTNTILCMTSNAGSSDRTGETGFGKTLSDMSKNKVLKALGEFLRPEFIGRVDEVVVFDPLNTQSLQKIAALVLEEYKTNLADRGVALDWTEDALALLAEKAEGGRYGARQLRRAIRREVEDPMAQRAAEGLLPVSITVDAVDGSILLRGL